MSHPSPTATAVDPDRLAHSAGRLRQRSLTLRTPTNGLAHHLRHLRATSPATASAGDPTDALADHLALMHRLAERADSVARAFARADSSATVGVTIVGPGGSVTVRVDDQVARRVADTASTLRDDVLPFVGTARPAVMLRNGSPGIALAERLLGRAGAPAGTAAGVVAFLASARAVTDQGNPFRALRERGTAYAADVTHAGFDASMLAFTRAPSHATALAVVGTAAAWVHWRTFDERRAMAGALVRGVDHTQDTARNHWVQGVHRAADTIRDVARRAPAPGPFTSVAGRAADATEDAVDALDRALDATATGVRVAAAVGGHQAGRATDAVLRAGEVATDRAVETAADLADTIQDGAEQLARRAACSLTPTC